MFIYSPFSAIRGDFSLSLRHRELEFILENTVRAKLEGQRGWGSKKARNQIIF